MFCSLFFLQQTMLKEFSSDKRIKECVNKTTNTVPIHVRGAPASPRSSTAWRRSLRGPTTSGRRTPVDPVRMVIVRRHCGATTYSARTPARHGTAARWCCGTWWARREVIHPIELFCLMRVSQTTGYKDSFFKKTLKTLQGLVDLSLSKVPRC